MSKIKNCKIKINDEWIKTVKTTQQDVKINKGLIEKGVIQNIYEPFIYYNYELLYENGGYLINLTTVVLYPSKTDIYCCTRSIHNNVKSQLDTELVNCCFFTRIRTIEPDLENKKLEEII